MNIFAAFRARIDESIRELIQQGVVNDSADLSRISVEPPREASHGDMATNAAMVLSKFSELQPLDLAGKIADLLSEDKDIVAIDIAGPGFINLSLAPSVWQGQVANVLRAGTAYGNSDIGAEDKVNIEYVSANPTGPMHVGHARGAVVGDALARLLERANYQVTREYYINDAGSQTDTLARSALIRMREALGEDIGDIPEGLYPGDYLIGVGQALATEYGAALFENPEVEQIAAAKSMALPMMMEMIKDDLDVLGVNHDVFLSEQSLHDSGAVDNSISRLDEMGLIYEGVLEPPKGKTPPPDWEPSPQTLFKSSEFGDDSDRALKKSDGSWTYFAPDIACHLDKFERGYKQMIDVWGADHAGYIKRMKSAVTAVTAGAGNLDVKICQMVKLMRDGEPVKMSKRAGQFITLREVVDEVGKDVVRFMMLTRKNDAPLEFDFVKVQEQSRDNPVFYVQYAHARICSVIRNAEEIFGAINDDDLADADAHLIGDPAEIALLKMISAFPRVLESAAVNHEPHRIAFYLQDLASTFHSLWNLGKERPDLKFIIEDKKNVTMARVSMIRCCAFVIASGLDIIGVRPEEEMR
ncbi:gamma-glutamyl-gamma-aminobutyrate hydrolase protein [Candidatus Micropelagos thuwalensis]|uniref:Arginine--tRNA ligase n=1 Tax=Candidatus Micropelagius thuwalensis TaxID=1397666 RepID=U2WVC2_9PROT|nr:arginine--tRNA ligase [Candidatus Micropelagos thuwalensis]ERL47473.1 gamma-glutamyl-gamma-aminobutyrate hydrolase protein [Candidatus Micropelagos thuwalensis]